MAKKLKNDPVNVLRRAKAYIERHGWTQDSLMKRGRVCTLGAFRAVSTDAKSYVKAIDLFAYALGGFSVPSDNLCRKRTEVISALQTAINRARRLEKAKADAVYRKRADR